MTLIYDVDIVDNSFDVYSVRITQFQQHSFCRFLEFLTWIMVPFLVFIELKTVREPT